MKKIMVLDLPLRHPPGHLLDRHHVRPLDRHKGRQHRPRPIVTWTKPTSQVLDPCPCALARNASMVIVVLIFTSITVIVKILKIIFLILIPLLVEEILRARRSKAQLQASKGNKSGSKPKENEGKLEMQYKLEMLRFLNPKKK